MSRFEVLSDLKHDGAFYKTGAIIEGHESAFGSLVNQGVLRLMEAVEEPKPEETVVADTQEAVQTESVATTEVKEEEPSAVKPLLPYEPSTKVEDLGANL